MVQYKLLVRINIFIDKIRENNSYTPRSCTNMHPLDLVPKLWVTCAKQPQPHHQYKWNCKRGKSEFPNKEGTEPSLEMCRKNCSPEIELHVRAPTDRINVPTEASEYYTWALQGCALQLNDPPPSKWQISPWHRHRLITVIRKTVNTS